MNVPLPLRLEEYKAVSAMWRASSNVPESLWAGTGIFVTCDRFRRAVSERRGFRTPPRKMHRRKIVKYTLRTLLGLVAALVLIPASLYIPAVQDFVRVRAERSVARSLGMELSIGRIRLAFPLRLSADDVLLRQRGDTLVRCGRLSLDVALLPLLRSRAVIRNIKLSLFWAFFYNTLGIPLAAGVFYGALGWRLSPMFGAAAMSLSSVCVVTNALRLRGFRPLPTAGHAGRQDPAFNDNNTEEDNQMKEIIAVEGMHCQHCVASVTKELEALDGVKDVKVNLSI